MSSIRATVLLVAIGMQTAGCAPVQGYRVTIDPNLAPRWSATAAAAAAMDRIERMERGLGRRLAEPRIVSVEAVSGASRPFGDASLAGYAVVWIVKANGTFTNEFGPPGRVLAGSYGWFLFDDDGQAIGSGFEPAP